MKKYLIVFLLLSVPIFSADDGSRVGCWNTGSTDYNITAEAALAGMIFEYGGVADQIVDSCAFYLNVTVANQEHKAALYVLDPGVAWNFVDSTNWITVTASADSQWVSFTFQEGYTLIPSATDLYCVAVSGEGDGGAGLGLAFSIDSTGGEGQRAGSRTYANAWPSTLEGSTSAANTNVIAYVNYAVAGGEPDLPHTYIHGPGDTAYVHGPAGAKAVHKR